MKDVGSTDRSLLSLPSSDINDDDSEVAKSDLWTDIHIIVGCSLITLVSATPQAVNVLAGNLQNDTHVSSLFMSVFQGLGVMGVQMTLPQGRVLDRYGCVVLTCGGALSICSGLVLVSLVSHPALLAPLWLLVGAGSGGTFLAGFSTALAMGNSYGIALTAVCMSLCLSLFVWITQVYRDSTGCTEDHCWRQICRVWACVACPCFLLGLTGLWRYRSRQLADHAAQDEHDKVVHADDASPLLRQSSGDSTPQLAHSDSAALLSPSSGGQYGSVRDPADRASSSEVSTPASLGSQSVRLKTHSKLKRQDSLTLRQATRIFRERFFWMLFWTNLIGIASGFLIVTQAQQLWEAFNSRPDRAHWFEHILSAFSYINAAANVVSPVLCDWLESKRLATDRTVLVVTYVVMSALFCVVALVNAEAQPHPDSHARLFVGLLGCVGFGWGTYLVLIPRLIATVFTIENYGTYISFLTAGSASTALIVPTLAEVAYDKLGSYQAVYWAFACLLLLCAVLTAITRPPASRI